MREDMQKLLVTCYRSGSSDPNYDNLRVRRTPVSVDDEGEQQDSAPGTKMGMRQKSYEFRKEFGENLAPLRRFLRTNVGRPWDKVFSEICEHCSSDGAVSGHIFQHIWGYVTPAKDIEMRDGKPWKVRWGHAIESYEQGTSFYVHPETGILLELPTRANARRARKKKRAEYQEFLKENFKHIGKHTMLCRAKNEKWYILRFKPQVWVSRPYTYFCMGVLKVKERMMPLYSGAKVPELLFKPAILQDAHFYLESAVPASKGVLAKHHL